MALVKSFDIFESLDNATVTANFYLAEGTELVNEFPLGGEEQVEITMQTPGKGSITYKFLVESLRGMKTGDNAMIRSYVMSCCTKDFLLNNSIKYSKRYKDQKYDVAVDNVIKDMGAQEKLITKESTEGKFDYVVNNVRPFQTIDLICERAVSSTYKSSFFVFYQDNKGYHFTTVEKLIEERKGGAVEFTYDSGNRSDPYEQRINYRNILVYETPKIGDAARKVAKGAIRNQFREFDFHRGTYFKKKEYKNLSDQGSFKKTDDNNDFNSADYNAFASKFPGMTRMAIKDATRPDMKHNENIHYQRAFRERMYQNQIRCRVYGDTDMRVGDVVRLILPEVSGITRAPQQGKIFSEKYIITNLKHRCDQTRSGGFEHFMIMDVTKIGNFKKPLG